MDIQRINGWSETEARTEFLRCCGAMRWAERMAARRPFAGEADLFAVAEQVLQGLTRDDWLEAFAAHPKIGDLDALRAKFATTGAWPTSEQAGVAGAAETTLQALAEKNRQYEDRFGYIFIVCASGKTAAEMLALLEQRLHNDPAEELLLAAGEQAKITQLRLRKL